MITRLLRWLSYTLWYLRRPPWDTGVTPPELERFIEANPPGRVLDLGCGTGTNALRLAQAGWQATGVDFVAGAIRAARAKARQAGAAVDFRVGNVAALDDLPGPFELILDIGCLHSLPAADRPDYYRGLARLLAPGGTFLLYAFVNPADPASPIGLAAADLEALSAALTLIERQDGSERGRRPSAWFIYRKPL
jgi:SAM-dependent methyltransferase